MATKNPKMNESVTTLSHVLSNGTEIVIERTTLTPEKPKLESFLGDSASADEPAAMAKTLVRAMGTLTAHEYDKHQPREHYTVTLKQRGPTGKVTETKFSLGHEETKEFLGLFSMLQGAHVIGCLGR